MKKFDAHVHSVFSHDGKLPIEELVRCAAGKADGFCVTDHCDFDLQYGECKANFKCDPLDVEAYYKNFVLTKKAIKDDKNNSLTLLFGIEAGFSAKGDANKRYEDLICRYPFDEVINSVHCVGGKEAYFRDWFYFKSKKRAYGEYLETVLDSLDAPYPYDVVAHIGYITHGAPYRDKELRYEDFPDLFDAILKGIIARGKTLEINFHHDVHPSEDVLRRYFELGGRDICYGGDSHRGEICARIDEFEKLASGIGFEGYNHFEGRVPVFVPFGRDD